MPDASKMTSLPFSTFILEGEARVISLKPFLNTEGLERIALRFVDERIQSPYFPQMVVLPRHQIKNLKLKHGANVFFSAKKTHWEYEGFQNQEDNGTLLLRGSITGIVPNVMAMKVDDPHSFGEYASIWYATAFEPVGWNRIAVRLDDARTSDLKIGDALVIKITNERFTESTI